MDNARENKKLELKLKHVVWRYPMVIEYTARDTPQQNSPVEVGLMPWQISHVLLCIMQTYLWKCGIDSLGRFLLQ